MSIWGEFLIFPCKIHLGKGLGCRRTQGWGMRRAVSSPPVSLQGDTGPPGPRGHPGFPGTPVSPSPFHQVWGLLLVLRELR